MSAPVIYHKLPDELNGVKLPLLSDLDDTCVSDADNTVRWFHQAIQKMTNKAGMLFDPSTASKYPLQRLAKVVEIQKKTGKEKPEVRFHRTQAADSLLKLLYGEEHVGGDQCDKCKNDSGTPWGICVTLDDLSPGCACCHYGGKPNSCTLVKVEKKRKRPLEDNMGNREVRVRCDLREREIMKALEKIPSSHLKSLSLVFTTLSDRAKESGDYDDDDGF